MIKGKSTIQLFNAQTGKLEHEEENTNIVTNAIEDILNYNDPFGLGVRRRDTYFPQKTLYPFTTTAFGGVFLWNGNIAEDPSITMPPDGILETGHAGGQYSGTNQYRGSYNTNESGSINEEGRRGYRHVWDFGTDKANGTIKCLSLTSVLGGTLGYCNEYFNEKNNGTSISAYCLGSSFETLGYGNGVKLPALDKLPNITKLLGVYEIKEDQNTIKTLIGVVISENNKDKYQVLEVSIPKEQNKLSLSTWPALFTASYKVIIENLDTKGTNNANGIKPYLYNDKFYECSIIRETDPDDAKKYLYYAEIIRWTKGGEREENVKVLLPETPYTYNEAAFFYEGAVYYRTSAATIGKCDLDGKRLSGAIGIWNYRSEASGGWDYIDSIRVMPDGNLNVIYYYYSSGTYCGRIIIDKRGTDSLMPVSNRTSNLVAASSVKSPLLYRFMRISDNEIGNDYLITPMIDVDPRYLATINNLATPVNKTEAQTMKVTYELIEV